jgi:hypothetical protein
MWGQLGFVYVKSGYDCTISCHLEGIVFVRDVSIYHRNYDQSPINEYSVGHVLCYTYSAGIYKFYVTYSGLHGTGDVSDRGVQTDVFDFAQIAEQRLHLIFCGLGGYVGHLDHFCISYDHF